MSSQKNHLLTLTTRTDGTARTDGSVEHIFLIDQTGSDFTFYVRDDAKVESERLCRILQQGKGRADSKKRPAADGVEGDDKAEAAHCPDTEALARLFKDSLGQKKEESSFSCRINVLRPVLNRDDFVWRGKRIVFLQRLRDAKNKKPSARPYAALLLNLTKRTHDGLDGGADKDAELLEEVIRELNKLLERGLTRKDFDKRLTAYEDELVAQVKEDPDAQTRLSDYLELCSRFDDAIKSIGSRIRRGRVLAGLSYEGRFWSITFRKQDTGTGYAPSEEIDGTLNTIEELCRVLYEQIFNAVSRSEATANAKKNAAAKPPELGGLVVIAGSTNSAKSLITRGLIHLYLKDALGSGAKRRPHLVTFEDPIEKNLIFEPGAFGVGNSRPDGDEKSLEEQIDYTPRQQGIDAAELDDALHDALRQTPKVFFVGETRRNEDWRRLIDFAATGHLVITTAHAGSLIEAMHKILLAAKAKTPADRNEVASRLLAVVQLKRAEVAGYKNCDVLVPAVWRRVPRGVNSLTAEGLASILPHSHSDEDRPCSSLGRKYFAERLLQLAEARINDSKSQTPLKTKAIINDPNFSKALTAKAIEWDLQGA